MAKWSIVVPAAAPPEALCSLASLNALEIAVVSPLRRISKRRNVFTDCSIEAALASGLFLMEAGLSGLSIPPAWVETSPPDTDGDSIVISGPALLLLRVFVRDKDDCRLCCDSEKGDDPIDVGEVLPLTLSSRLSLFDLSR